MLFVDAGNNYIVIGSATANANDSAFFDTNGILSIARTSGIGRTMIDFRNAGASVGGVSTSTSATQYNTSSDVRLKENIADANDAGSKIDAIQVRQYDWKADALTKITAWWLKSYKLLHQKLLLAMLTQTK
jgi:hypothetical protein